MWNKCGTVLFAGLLSGSILGVIEAVQLLLAVGAGEYDALFWGAVGYAIVGSMVSFPLILLFWNSSKIQRFAWTTPIVMGAMGFGILHWHPWVAVFLCAVPWLIGIILEKTPLRILQTPKGALGWTIFWFGLLTVFSLAPSRTVYSPPVHQNSSLGKPSVIMVIVDGLTVSHFQRGSMPALNAFAKNSIQFEQSFTDGVSGFSTLASALVGETVASDSPLLEGYTTIAERFAYEGYQTMALVSDESVGRFSNLHQGFDRFRYLPPKFNNRFLRIGLHNEGTFHLELFKLFQQFLASERRQIGEVMHQFNQELSSLNMGSEPWFALLHVSPPRMLLGEELRELDRHLGQLLRNIDGPIVVLTGTPEARLEQIPIDPRVPLFMRLSPPVQKTIKNPVQLSEVAYTLSSIVGIDPDQQWRSNNIIRLPPMEKNRPIHLHHHTPNFDLDFIQIGDWRWIRQSGTEYLYQVSSDPGLEHNVIHQFPDIKNELIQHME